MINLPQCSTTNSIKRKQTNKIDIKFDSKEFTLVEMSQHKGGEISISLSLNKGFCAEFKEGESLTIRGEK